MQDLMNRNYELKRYLVLVELPPVSAIPNTESNAKHPITICGGFGRLTHKASSYHTLSYRKEDLIN
jgi:hypothetical protein